MEPRGRIELPTSSLPWKRSTAELPGHKLRSLGFLVRSMLLAMQTVLLEFQASLDRLLIFRGKIIDAFAFRTFELDERFLRHRLNNNFI